MFEHIKEAIEKSNEILILPHKNADGDCLGSSYALKLALLSLGKKAEVILEPGEDNERICKILYGTEKCDVQNSDLVIAVDCGDLERIGTRGEIFLNCDETISIDHHKTNTKYAKYNLVDSCASAAGELIYELIGVLGATVTKEIASDLYAAIASDSGRFSYSNTTPKTMRIGADLIEKGINHSDICTYLFCTNTLSSLKLKACAYNSLETFDDGKIAMISVTMDDIKSCGATLDEAGALIDIPRTLDTAKASLSLREMQNGIKVSFRSNHIDVSKIAEGFGGGGHERAAACVLKMGLQEAKATLTCELEKYI